MKCVLISIKPKWCELIANGTKTVELRKTKPKLIPPFKCYVYCTKPSKKYQTVAGSMVLNDDELFKLPNGKIKYGNSIELIGYDGYSKDNFLNSKVIGEFICDDVFMMWDGYAGNQGDDCLTFDEREEYLQGNNGYNGYGWHISDLKIYDEPKDIGEFYKSGMLSYDDWLYGIYNGNGGARSSYESYKNAFKLSKAPQSWCYVEEVKE